MRILIAALLSVLIVHFAGTPANLNNSISGVKNQQVQAETPRKEPTAVSQEKAQTKPEAEPKPELKPLTDKEQLMQAAGISQGDWAATDYIVSHESAWSVTATNPDSGAYGLCQALPASKMASAGDDYNSNPVTQLKWCHDYSMKRYGGWWNSFAYWKANQWW